MKRAPTRSFALFLILALLGVAGARATLGPTLQMQLGNPSNATADTNNHAHFLIQRMQYALDYSDTSREPNWVAWNLTTTDVGGSGRSPDFYVDTTLPAGFYRVLTTDYSGSGFDRGHMCPSADRTATTADNQVTFFMSNMVPQTPDNNQGVWASFETYCRTLAAAGNELLIVSGPGGFAGTSLVSGVAIPGYTWKVVAVVPLGAGTALSRITAATRVIAIKIPNVAGVRSNPWQQYLTSAAQIEADTGYTFFTALPDTLAATLRAKVDGQSAAGTPVITTQPAAQTVAVGGSATFSVSATGDAPLTYQWSLDDNEIAGATAATLTLTNVQAAAAGNYTVVVTNAVGSATSADAALVITGLPPVIVTPPAARSAAAGTNVTFAVTSSGSPTLAYQWRKNGAPLPGATSATLVLLNVQNADAANYDVVVTNSVGTATSAAAALTVTPAAPTIVTQPTAQVVAAGGNSTVSFVVVARGTAPLGYQWRKAGVPITDNASATTATLTLVNISAADAGSYDVVVTNGVNPAATSATATLNVLPAPAANILTWDFTTDTPIFALPPQVTGAVVTRGNNNGTTTLLTNVSVASGYSGVSGGNNAGAAARIGALNQADGTGSAYFEFTLNAAAGQQVVVSSLSFGARSTATGPQAFSVFTSLDNFTTPIATGPLANDSVWRLIAPAFTTFAGVPGSALTIRIYGYAGVGNAGASTANWRIDDLKLGITVVANSATPPVITRQPGNVTLAVGRTATLTVAATGTPAPTFQWRKDGVPIAGATGATLTLTNLSLAQAGSYSVVVSNSAASVASAAVPLRVLRRSYAGYYMGTFIPRPIAFGPIGGSFGLLVREDNTGVFLGYERIAAFLQDLPAGGYVEHTRAYVGREVSVDENGFFDFLATSYVPNAAFVGGVVSPPNSPPVTGLRVSQYAFRGSISDTGTLSSSDPGGSTMSATRSPDTSLNAAIAGFYTGGADASFGQALAMVSSGGEGVFVVLTSDTVDAARGGLNFLPPAPFLTLERRALLLGFSASGSFAATYTDGQGRPWAFTGFSESSAGAARQQLANISTRARAGVGDDVAIVGFAVTGLESKTVLIRGVGPTLQTYGVGPVLAAPRLNLMRGSTVIATNTGWANNAALASAAVNSGAFPLAANSADSAILTTLPPGNYTAVASASDGRPGIALVEVYDVSGGSNFQRLINVSTRAATGPGDDTLIAGLVVSGAAPKRLLIRAAGPALTAYGVAGALPRPQLTVLRGNTVLAQNAGWRSSPDATAIADAAQHVGAFAFQDSSADSALIINLAPGSYTAQVSGLGTATGIALVEVYELP